MSAYTPFIPSSPAREVCGPPASFSRVSASLYDSLCEMRTREGTTLTSRTAPLAERTAETLSASQTYSVVCVVCVTRVCLCV